MQIATTTVSGTSYSNTPACIPNFPLCKDPDCLDCVDGVFWVYSGFGSSKKCMHHCFDGYYYPNSTLDYQCQPCEDSNCKVCAGPGTGQCYICNQTHYLNVTGGNLGVCLPSCASPLWGISNMAWGGWTGTANLQPAFCRACHWSCATCIT